jgi:hypothetical protein
LHGLRVSTVPLACTLDALKFSYLPKMVPTVH